MTVEIDAEVGARVHTAMWRARINQKQAAAALGLDQAAVNRRLRGTTAWKVSEVLRLAVLLNTPVSALIPSESEVIAEAPSQSGKITVSMNA